MLEPLQKVLERFDSWLWGNWLLFMLVGIGVLYTFVSSGIQVFHLSKILRQCLIAPLLGRRSKDGEAKGTVSSLQALCVALASCVGSGNIVGVTTALLVGGLGALFWMWFAAFWGMATKYGEVVLGMLYRRRNEAGQYTGGPFYYIEQGLGMPWLAFFCAFFMVVQIVGGNLIQSNTISGVLYDGFGIPCAFTGAGLILFVFLVAIGGMKRLAAVAQRLVPFMALLYVATGLAIILLNIDKIPLVLFRIVSQAFSTEAAAGGAVGTVMKIAMEKGVARGLYSNEAGEGSAPVIHAVANVDHPCRQGLMGVAEVFLDTFVICSITGLVLGVTDSLSHNIPGNILMIYAFSSVWEPLRYIVIVSLLLFSLTSLMTQWYFGFVGLNYMFGHSIADKFKYVFPLFCMVGALLKVELVWTLQDIALAFLVLPNLVAMLVLFPQVRNATRDFLNILSFEP